MVLKLLLVVLILPAYFPVVGTTHWFFRGFDFTRIQWVIIQAIGLGVILFFGPKNDSLFLLLSGTLLLTCFYQLSKILPFTVFAKKQTQDGHIDDKNTFTVLTANVFQDNQETDELLKLVKKYQPDIFLAMETDKKWEKAMEALPPEYKYRVRQPLDNYYGMLLYSRLEFIDPTIEFIIEKDVPSIHTKVKLPSGKLFYLRCIHPAPPSPTENETSEERDAELMIVAKEIRKANLPTVVCGDLNDVAWSRSNFLFKKTGELLDPRIGRGLYPTFHSRYFFLRFPVDHLFHSADFFTNEIDRLPYFGSDHFPMWYKLTLKVNNNQERATNLTSVEKTELKKMIENGKS